MRIRSIKPGFFKDEDLAEISARARLLAIGLLCLADGVGRLEDRPKRIRAEVFPYENDGVENELADLAEVGFIRRYTSPDHPHPIIQIVNFSTHQRITGKEAAYESTLPEEGKQWGNTGETPGKQWGNTRETGVAQEREREREIERERSTEIVPRADGSTHPVDADLALEGEDLTPQPKRQPVPIKEIVSAYNRICTSMPACQVPTDARKAAIRNLWHLLKEDMTNLELYFEQAQASEFLSGRSGRWKACNIDWLCKKANAAKVLEGNYDNEREA